MRRLAPRTALTGAGTLLVLVSLGLPWSRDTYLYVAGFFTPSICTPSADGTLWCSGGFISPGYTTGSPAASGAETSARVFLVAALVLVAVAAYRSARRPLLLAGSAALVGVLLSGQIVLGGPVSAAAGGVLLVLAGRATPRVPSRLGFPRVVRRTAPAP